MANKLLIVESPAKARTIKKILGRSFMVKASVGHIRDLDSKGSGKKGFGIDLENGYEPRYIIIPGKKKTVDELKGFADKAEEVYLAPDPDREGEAIAWHLKETLGLDDGKIKRIVYHAVTKKAVREAVANPKSIDMNLVSAQKGRRVLDRLVGFSLSPFLWKKVAKNLSAGRVQSVAQRLVVEREREIAVFVPREFWKIDAVLHAEQGNSFRASLVKWKGEEFGLGGKFSSDEENARKVESILKASDFRVVDVIGKETVSHPNAPFITSTLQQAASGQLRFGTRRTMKVAQRLYEGVEVEGEAVGLITYMRTDSTRIDSGALSEIRDWIGEHHPDQLSERPRFYGVNKRAQDAHEAIRPTSMHRNPESIKAFLSPEQYKLYELIWRRTVAGQMKDARYMVTTVTVAAADGILEAKGRVTLFKGYTILIPESKKTKEDYQDLPKLHGGEPLELDDLNTEQSWTKPPPRYTEASLVRSLEKMGIGRPSTYASIIQTIQDRGYVFLEKRAFHASELGMAVNDILIREFPQIMDVRFTSGMESSLDSVERGEADWHKLVDEFYRPFSARVEEAIEKADPLKNRDWEGEERCPVCGSGLVVRFSKNGAFLGCSRYPECKGLMSLPGEGPGGGAENAEVVDCPRCGKPMNIKASRYGKFYACTDYPDCKTTVNMDAEGRPMFLPKIDKNCDECGTPMEVKSKRRGPVLVCPNPDCRRELPIGKDGKVMELPQSGGTKCEKCGAPMIVRLSRRGPFLACTNFPKCRNAKNLSDRDGKTDRHGVLGVRNA